MFVDGEKECYVTSFYLESKKDIYKNKSDGTKMNTFDVLCLYIEDTQNYQGVEFAPDWVKIRNLVKENDKYDEMRALLKKGRICTKLIEDELKQIVGKIVEIEINMKKLQKDKQILELEYAYYFDEYNKEESILKLMDYDIDIEEQSMDIKELEQLIDKTNKEILNDDNLLKKLHDKEQKISLTASEIASLDINVIKKVYIPLIKNSKYWKDEFWRYFIHNYEYQKENIYPRQLRQIYLEWSKKEAS